MKKNILVFFILAFFTLLIGESVLAAYVPLENIPGSKSDNITTFPGYINAVYKFALWAVGISALLMISIGGFMYFAAAGNTSKMEGGKKIIADALYGLIAVLFAWLLLNTINPNLTNINLNSVKNINNNSGANNNTGAPQAFDSGRLSDPIPGSTPAPAPETEPDAIDLEEETTWDPMDNPEVI